MVKKKPARRGRPSSGIKRPHRVVVLFSAEELEEINAAAGSERSAWLRKVTLAATRGEDAS